MFLITTEGQINVCVCWGGGGEGGDGGVGSEGAEFKIYSESLNLLEDPTSLLELWEGSTISNLFSVVSPGSSTQLRMLKNS